MNVLTSLLPALLIVPSLVYGQAKEGWREVFRDDFERQELGPRWNKGSGAEIKDGWLTTGGRETFAWIRQELAFPAIRIEYDAYVRRVTPKSAFSDLSCALSPSREPGFQKEACWFLFASGNNEKSELRGPQGFSLKTDSAKAKAKEGRVYHVRAELNGRVMRLSINGRMLIEGLQSIDPQRRFACVYSWSGIARFDNVRVMVKDQADPVPAGILAPEPAGIYEMQQTLAHIRDWSLPEIANPKPPSTDIIRVPIKIENVVDGAGTFPVTFGVPVPRDTIWDSDSIRIVDSEGNEMPSQFEITGTWNDPRRGGSVRWLLADFTPAVAESGYSVEYGRRVRRSAIDSPLIVRKTDTSIAVESRQLKVMVSKTRGTVLEALWYDPDGKRQFTELTRILNSERHRGAYFIDQKGKLCATWRPDSEYSVSVESKGPLRVVIRSRGWYTNKKGERACYFTHRLYIYRDLPHLRLFTTWVITVDTDDFWFDDLGLKLPLAGQTGLKARFGLDSGFRQESEAIAPLDHHARMVQESWNRGRLMKGKEEVREFERTGGFVDWSGDRYGLTAALRDMCWQFPNALEAGPEGLTVHLWSSEPGPQMGFSLDFIRRRWGERTYQRYDKSRNYLPPFHKRQDNGRGMAKSHELLLHLHPPGQSPDQTDHIGQLVYDPPWVVVNPEYTCGTRAFGLIAPADFEAHPELEKSLQSKFEKTRHQAFNAHPFTGFFDFGQGYLHSPAGKTEDGRFTDKGYRKGYDLGYAQPPVPWLMFLRSGDRRYTRFMVAQSRYARDLRLQHWHDPKHASRIGYMDIEGAAWAYDARSWTFNNFNEYHYLDYYVTGDRRSLEVALEWNREVHKYVIKEKNRPSYMGTVGVFLGNTAAAYTAMWEPDFLKTFQAFQKTAMRIQCPICGGLGHKATDASKHGTTHRDGWVEYGWDLAYRAPEEDWVPGFKNALQKYGHGLLYQKQVLKSSFGPFQIGCRTAGILYEMTKDPWYALYAQNLMKISPGKGGMLGGNWALLSPPLFAGVDASQLVLPESWKEVTLSYVDLSPVYLVHTKGAQLEATIQPKLLSNPFYSGQFAPYASCQLLGPDGQAVRQKWFKHSPYYARYEISLPPDAPVGPYRIEVHPTKDLLRRAAWDQRLGLIIRARRIPSIIRAMRKGTLYKWDSAYFRVGQKTRQFRLRVRDASPVKVKVRLTAPSGRVIRLDTPNAAIQVSDGKAGVWEIHQEKVNLPDNKTWRDLYHRLWQREEPALFLEVQGVEPFLCNRRRFPLPEDAGEAAAIRRRAPAGGDYGEGRFGQGLRLGSGRVLVIPAGDVTSAHARKFFDAASGTIEFWFRLDRPDWESPYPVQVPLMVPAVDPAAGKIAVPLSKPLIEWGGTTWRYGNGKEFTTRNLQPWIPWRIDGRWHHLCISYAHTFKFKANNHAFFRVWLDGAPRYQPYDWSIPVAIEPGQAGEYWRIGGGACSPLTLDDLRVSTGRRHNFSDVFDPPGKPHSLDKNALVHFGFDGNLIGQGPNGRTTEATLKRDGRSSR